MNRLRGPLLQRLALLIALFGITLRALIPAGFMPATDAHRGALLMLCSGGVLKAAGDEHPGAGKTLHHAMQSCVFAAAAAAPPPAPLLLPRTPAATAARHSIDLRSQGRAPAWMPPATGPPSAA